jgi:hypothetical protein
VRRVTHLILAVDGLSHPKTERNWRRCHDPVIQLELADYADALASFGRGEGVKTQVLPAA